MIRKAKRNTLFLYAIYNTSKIKYVGFPHQPILQLSVDTKWVGVPQFNPILILANHPELAQPHRLRAESQKAVPYFGPSVKFWVLRLFTLSDFDYKTQVPQSTSSCLITCSNFSQNSGQHFTYIFQFTLKNIIKDTKRYIVEVWMVPECRNIGPHGVGAHHFPSHG